jgi:hypothetical protein
MVTALHMCKVQLVQAGRLTPGPKPWAIPPPCRSVTSSDELRNRQGPTMAARCDSADPLRQVREVAPRRLSLMFASGRKDWEDQSDRNCQRCQNRYCRRGEEGYRVPSPCRSTELTEDANSLTRGLTASTSMRSSSRLKRNSASLLTPETRKGSSRLATQLHSSKAKLTDFRGLIAGHTVNPLRASVSCQLPQK